MKIRFKVHHRPRGDAADIPSYKAGETYTFEGISAESYANKYVRLGLAVVAVDEPVPAVVEETPVVDVPIDYGAAVFEGEGVSVNTRPSYGRGKRR